MMNFMNAPIINRTSDQDANGEPFVLPSDGWYQIEVPGTHMNRGTGVNQVIDDAAVRSMVNRFNQEKADWKVRNGTEFPGMLIDFDHFSYDTDKSSGAAGWVTGMRAVNRDASGMLYPEATIRWSNRGKEAVMGGDFRFFSTVYLPGEVQVLGEKRVRPLRIDRLALTNDPNNKGGKPISNRAADPKTQDEPKDNTTTMKKTATAFGLPEDSTDDVLANRAGELITENAALKKERASLLEAQVEADLDRLKNRYHPDARKDWKDMLLKNREGGLKLLESAGPIVGDKKQSVDRIHNRSESKSPEGTPGAEQTQAEKQLAAVTEIRNRAGGKLTHQQAWDQAMAEKPELFAEPA